MMLPLKSSGCNTISLHFMFLLLLLSSAFLISYSLVLGEIKCQKHFQPNRFIFWINRLTTITIIIVIMVFRWNFINTNSIHYVLIALYLVRVQIDTDRCIRTFQLSHVSSRATAIASACACHSPKIGS